MRTPTTIALGGSTPRWRRATRDDRDDDRHHPLQPVAEPTLGHQRVQGDDREPGERHHLDRRHRPAAPAPSQGNPEGTGQRGDVVQARGHQLSQLDHDQVDEEETPSPEDDQRHVEHQDRQLDRPPRRGVADTPGDAIDARQIDVAHPPDDRVVDDDDVDRHAPNTVAEDQRGGDDSCRRRRRASRPRSSGDRGAAAAARPTDAAVRASRPGRPRARSSTITCGAPDVDGPSSGSPTSLTDTLVGDGPCRSVPAGSATPCPLAACQRPSTRGG